MSQQRSGGDEKRVVNLEDLKSRESTRISTAEDVKALLEAEFRGIAEIQNSHKLTEDEFKQIESLYWHKMGQNAEGRSLYAGERSMLNGGGEYRTDQLQTLTMPHNQYTTTTLPETKLVNYDYPKDSLRHEAKMKRHILEEVVLEDSDRFYEKTLPKKTKTIYVGNEKSVSSGELRNPYQNEDTYQRERTLDHVSMRDQYLVPNAKPRHMKKHQSEIIVGDTMNVEEASGRSYGVNKENSSTFPREYYTHSINQERQNELSIDGVDTFKDKNYANTPLKLRNNFENEIQKSLLEKEKHRKSRLEGTECKIRHNPKITQNEIVLEDKRLVEETQHYDIKKNTKKPSYTSRFTAPKFRNRFRKSKKSSKNKSKLDYSSDVHNVPTIISSRQNQEEVVLENLNTFSETTFSKKKQFEMSDSLGKSQNKLRKVEEDLYEQSTSRFQPIEHKGPQKEIFLSGQEIVSETTLTRPKKKKFKKSPKFNAEVTNLSSKILESQNNQTKSDGSVVLTNVVYKDPEYSYEDGNKEIGVTQKGIDENGFYVEENRQNICAKGKKSKGKTGKQKSKRSLFKRKKVVSEIVIEDSEIYEDHNKPKKIHLSHGGVIHMAEVDDMDLGEYVDEEKEDIKNKKNNKQKNTKKSKKTNKQGETIVDKSFVYEDALNIGFSGAAELDADTKSKQETMVDSWPKKDTKVETESKALKEETQTKPKINVLNYQGETILNGNNLVKDDTKLGFTAHTTVDKKEDIKKNDKEDKLPKLKFKIPDYLKRKSKSSERKEEVIDIRTVDFEDKRKHDNETVIMETKPNLPDIQLPKLCLNSKKEKKESGDSKNAENSNIGKQEGEASGKVGSETKVIKIVHSHKNDIPVINTATQKKEIKVDQEYVVNDEDNSKKGVDVCQQVNLPTIHVNRNFEKSNEVTGAKKDEPIKIDSKTQCSLIGDEIKTTEAKNEIKEVGKPKEETIELAPHEEILNDGTIEIEKTNEKIKGDKKSRINFPKFNISKPPFGRKHKEKQVEVVAADKKVELIEETNKTEPFYENSQKTGQSSNGPVPEVLRQEESKKVIKLTDNVVNKDDKNSFNAVLPIFNTTKPQLPQVPPPPMIRKTEKVPQPKIINNVEETKDIKTKENVENKTTEEKSDAPLLESLNHELKFDLKSEENTIKNIYPTNIEHHQDNENKVEEIKINAADLQPIQTVEKQVEIKEATKDVSTAEGKAPDKKFKIPFPHFNISKPSFTFKKNKEQKGAKAFDEIITIIEPQNEIEAPEATQITVIPTVDTSVKKPDFEVVLPTVNVDKPNLSIEPLNSTSSQKTEISQLDDDVFDGERSILPVKIAIPERINSPEVSMTKPEFKENVKTIINEEKKDFRITDPTQTCAIDLSQQETTPQSQNLLENEISKKGKTKDISEDEKVKVPNKKFKLHFPTFGKKNKDKQIDKKDAEEPVCTKEIETTKELDTTKKEPIISTVNALDSKITENPPVEAPKPQSNNLDDKDHTVLFKEKNILKPKGPDAIPTIVSSSKFVETKNLQPSVIIENKPTNLPSTQSEKSVSKLYEEKAVDVILPAANIIHQDFSLNTTQYEQNKSQKTKEELDKIKDKTTIIMEDKNKSLISNEILKDDSKVEIPKLEQIKVDVEENKKKKTKSGFPNFSMPNYKFGFKSKKEKNVEHPEPQQLAETSIKVDTQFKDDENKKQTHVTPFLENTTDSLSKPIEMYLPVVEIEAKEKKIEDKKVMENVQTEAKLVTDSVQEKKTLDVVLPEVNMPKPDLNLEVKTLQHDINAIVTDNDKDLKEENIKNVETKTPDLIIVNCQTGIAKDDVDESKKKNKKSAFSNFSMPKHNFNFGFKSKKDKNVEQPEAEKSVETSLKTNTVLETKVEEEIEKEKNFAEKTITDVKEFVEQKTDKLSNPIEINLPTVETSPSTSNQEIEKVSIQTKTVVELPEIEKIEKSEANKKCDVDLSQPKSDLKLILNSPKNEIEERVTKNADNFKEEKVANTDNPNTDLKVESIKKEPLKEEDNKKKKQKTGFHNFSLTKPTFNFGNKTKKDNNVELTNVINKETKKPQTKAAMDWVCNQEQITVKGDAIVEDSTRISFKPQKSAETNETTDKIPKTEENKTEKLLIEQTVTHVVKYLDEKTDISNTSNKTCQPIVEMTQNENKFPENDLNSNTKIESFEPTYVNVLEKNTSIKLNPLCDKTPTDNEKIELKNDKDTKSLLTDTPNIQTKDTSVNAVTETKQEEEKIEHTLDKTEDNKVENLKIEKNKPTFMGKLKSNLPQICIQKAVSTDKGSGCLGKKNQEKIEVTSKTIVAENFSKKKEDKSISEIPSQTENTLEKKKKTNILEKLHLKKPQKELVMNDTYMYTDNSTLGKKKKDNIYILENDLSEESPKKKYIWSKVKKQKNMEEAQAKEKQGEVVVVGDTLVTESMHLSKEIDNKETKDKEGGRLSAFLDENSKEGTTDTCKLEEVGQNKIVLDVYNKPIFNQKSVLEKEKSVENVQIESTADTEKSKLLVDQAGNELPVENSLQESIQNSTDIKPSNAAQEQNKYQTQTNSQNLKWNQSPNKKSAFFSTVPAAVSCHDDRKPLQFVVVAIDFGTTFSGYAFSFNKDLDSIHVMRKWEGGDPGVSNQKTPTILLLNPEGQFHSFGFTARDFYHDLSPKEALKWMYFEKFKMALHYNADLSSETEIRAANGNNFKALDVFSHALKFFRNHAIQEIGEQSNTPIYEDDIKWVITVPAIWKSPAKQFMREAAYKAGIASAAKADRLLIALEPEAASVFVRKQRLKQLIPESADGLKDSRSVGRSCQELNPPEHVDNITYPTSSNYDDASSHDQSMSSGVLNQSFNRCPSPTSFPVSVGQDVDITDNRFMVADCGGGTADITVYEMLSATGGKLKELYKATGGPYGSIGVDLEFENLLVSIFGLDYIEAFKAKRPAGWVDLMMAFESRKRAANPFKCKPLNVPLPFSFIDYHKKFKNSSVETVIKKYNNKNVLWSSQGMLRLLPEAMDQLFQPTLTAIVNAIRKVIIQPDVAGVSNIFMVGGFSESPMLQQEIRKNFANQSRILIPNDVSLTILKGAVLFGIDPSVVVIRKSRLTYGLGVLNRFIEGKHPETKKAMKDDEAWCVDVFDPLVTADQSVALGTSVIRSYTPASTSQKFSLFHIYCSEDKNVEFVTEEGVANCGTLRLDLDDHQWELETTPSRSANQQMNPQETVEETGVRREIQARLTFGDTEIKLVALDVSTGNYVRATLDFLNK